MSVRPTRKKRASIEEKPPKKRKDEEDEVSEKEETIENSTEQPGEGDVSQGDDDDNKKPTKKPVSKKKQAQSRLAKSSKPTNTKSKDKAEKTPAKDTDKDEDIAEETVNSPSDSGLTEDNEPAEHKQNFQDAPVAPTELVSAQAVALLEQLKTEISELKSKVAAQDAVIQYHLDKEYVLQTEFELLVEELREVKTQQQQISPQHAASKGWEKTLEELEFVKDEIHEVHAEVREWRIAMDIDLTDKEERVASVATRLDDVERNQQALLIRHPQLFGVPLQPQTQQSKQAPAQKIHVNKHDKAPPSQVRTVAPASASQSTALAVSSVSTTLPLVPPISATTLAGKNDPSSRVLNSPPNLSTFPLSNSTIKNSPTSILQSRPFKPPPVVPAQYKYVPQPSVAVSNISNPPTDNSLKPTEKKKRKRESGKPKITASPPPPPMPSLSSGTKSPMSGISLSVNNTTVVSSSLHPPPITSQSVSQPDATPLNMPPQLPLTPATPPQDFNEPLCTVCGDIGKILMCDGPCLRSWHLACIGLKDVPDEEPWLCADCKEKSWACFLCKKHHLDSDTDSGTKKCVLKQCGKHYHLSCVDAFSSTSSVVVSKPSEEGCSPFLCPRHFCYACGGGPPQAGSATSQQQIVHCFKCPRSYHKKCMPAECQKTKESKFIICPLHTKEFGNEQISSTTQASSSEPKPSTELGFIQDTNSVSTANKSITVEDFLDINDLQ